MRLEFMPISLHGSTSAQRFNIAQSCNGNMKYLRGTRLIVMACNDVLHCVETHPMAALKIGSEVGVRAPVATNELVEEHQTCIKPRLSQKIDVNDSEKNIPSTAANITKRSANVGLLSGIQCITQPTLHST
jgi:hypothetical protein